MKLLSMAIKSEKKENTMPIFPICVALSFILLGVYFNSLFSLLALVISVIMYFYLPEDDFIAYTMFLMPFANIFKSAPEAQSFFTYLILFYVLCSLLFKGKINKSFLLVCGILITYIVIQMFISFDILRSIKFIANVFLIVE